MSATNDLFVWYFQGYSGMGGWTIFLVLAVLAVSALIADSQRRRFRASGWLLAAILLACLIVPSVIYRFSSLEIRGSLEQFKETFFYLGLLGGILPPIIAIGYFVTYAGMSGCIQGHVFETALGSCPVCAEERAPAPAGQAWAAPSGAARVESAPTAPRAARRPSRPKVDYAWLVDSRAKHRYDLVEGITQLGRGDENDIVLMDPAVTRRGHAQIRESGGRFTLSDIGGKTSILLNGERLSTPMVLQNADKITVGDTVLTFVTAK